MRGGEPEEFDQYLQIDELLPSGEVDRQMLQDKVICCIAVSGGMDFECDFGTVVALHRDAERRVTQLQMATLAHKSRWIRCPPVFWACNKRGETMQRKACMCMSVSVQCMLLCLHAGCGGQIYTPQPHE